METLAQIYQVQNILLEAASAEANTGLEELGPNPGVQTTREADFINICASRLANRRQRVDGRNSLGEHGVCSKLREFRGPEIHRNDLIARNPAGIDIGEGSGGGAAGRGVERTDEDTIRGDEI